MKKYHSIIAIVSVAVAIIGLLPGRLHAESKLVEQSGLSGGIVVGLDFPDGKAVAALSADGNFVVHGLFTTDPGLEKAKQEIAQAGRYGRVSCDLYNGRDLPYIDSLVNLVLCKASC